jgi:hypothetical protein
MRMPQTGRRCGTPCSGLACSMSHSEWYGPGCKVTGRFWNPKWVGLFYDARLEQQKLTPASVRRGRMPTSSWRPRVVTWSWQQTWPTT